MPEPRTVITKRLPSSAPRGNLRWCGADAQHFVALALQADEFLRGAFAARHGEVLRGDRIAILEAGEAHLEGLAARGARQFARHPFGVRAAFAHAQQRVRPLAARGEAQDLVDFEVFGRGAQHAGAERLTPGGRRRQRRAAPVIGDHQALSGAGSSNTTACAASPSLRPTKPRCSVVVALMFTWFSVTPSICASERRISSR